MEELDEIEMELNDHPKGLQPWELTDEEIQHDLDVDEMGPILGYRTIATAAVKKYQEWLAKQCGEKPCVRCECQTDKTIYCDILHKEPETIGIVTCGCYSYWLGQQQGYAKGLQERGK